MDTEAHSQEGKTKHHGPLSFIAGDSNDREFCAFHGVELRRGKAGRRQPRGGAVSIKRWMKVLSVDRSSGVPRKDFVRHTANFEMWFAHETSWLIMRRKSLSD